MLADLTRVLDTAASDPANSQTLRQAVVEGNVLGKKTERTRVASWQRLGRLYGLGELNRITFLHLWHLAPAARPQLALLRALERDALLRISAPWVVALRPGEAAKPAELAAELLRLGVQYSDKTLRSISQNLLSSWTQAGWLRGKVAKQRVDILWHPAAAAYLLREAYLSGLRGAGLYSTPLADLLGLEAEMLDALAFAASQERLLSYRRLADVVEITFPGWNRAEAVST